MRDLKSYYYDAVGIGYGPSNLAMAVAHQNLRNRGDKHIPRIRFLDKRSSFDWHPGLLLDGADMQISFLKDLITLKDPTSEFTFLSYLKETSGLDDFINLRTFYPSRIEFRNYLRWAAAKLDSLVEYNACVSGVRPIREDGVVEAVEVNYVDQVTGYRNSVVTRGIVLATGGSPKYPNDMSNIASDKVVHSSEFLDKLANSYPNTLESYRFLVVGGGQSAAEMYSYLYSKYPNAQVSIVMTGIGFKPSDDSEFVNELFNQSFIDDYYNTDKRFRTDFLDEYYNTNYSVVDSDLISKIYADIYDDKRISTNRLRILRFSKVVDIKETNDVDVSIQDTTKGSTTTEPFDGVFLGTGYDFTRGIGLLDDIREYMVTDEDGDLIVNRDYSVMTTEDFNVKIYLQGPTEKTHGLSSVLLSVLPHRAHEILESIMKECSVKKIELKHEIA